MPSPGIIKHIAQPYGLGIRVDGYAYEGYEIPLHYDPMISKLIAWGKTREEAVARMRRALYEYKITGVKTSINFLEKVMEHPDFVSGNYNTHFIDKNIDALMTSKEDKGDWDNIAAIAAFVDYTNKLDAIQPKKNGGQMTNNWKAYGRQRNRTRI